jgi:hypothetical protein
VRKTLKFFALRFMICSMLTGNAFLCSILTRNNVKKDNQSMGFSCKDEKNLSIPSLFSPALLTTTSSPANIYVSLLRNICSLKNTQKSTAPLGSPVPYGGKPAYRAGLTKVVMKQRNVVLFDNSLPFHNTTVICPAWLFFRS